MKRNSIVFFTVISLISMLSACSKGVYYPNLYSSQSVSEPVEKASFKLFSTSDENTFLKLDTRNGKIWQVYVTSDYPDWSFSQPLSTTSLIDASEEKNGRFTLYQFHGQSFILLDQIDGRAWLVKWSVDEDKRGITIIKNKNQH
jgi:hypothetical protein